MKWFYYNAEYCQQTATYWTYKLTEPAISAVYDTAHAGGVGGGGWGVGGGGGGGG